MKVSLSVLDRVMLLNILPAENDVLTIKVVRALKESVAFNEEELIKHNIKSDEKAITWNKDAPDREFDITPKGIEVISKALTELNDKKKITENHIKLYDLFVEGK